MSGSLLHDRGNAKETCLTMEVMLSTWRNPVKRLRRFHYCPANASFSADKSRYFWELSGHLACRDLNCDWPRKAALERETMVRESRPTCSSLS